MTLGRCEGSGVGGLCLFLFRYGNPVKSPVFFVGMVTLFRVRYVFFFFFCLLGWGMGGSRRFCQFGVGDMWRVFVECVLLMAGLQPHLA